jgi:sugar phosphate isomerase/epimerase
MDLGIFSRTFEGPTLGAVLDNATAHGFELLHFNFRSAGLSAIPADLDAVRCHAIRSEIHTRHVRLAGVSGTFNAIHPDRVRREHETSLTCQLIALAPVLGTTLVSLSTGTRDVGDMWRGHPANGEPSAWSDLRYTLEHLLDAARSAGVILGIEPEHNNVVNSAHRARRILDEFHDDHLRIIFDAANLLTLSTVECQRSVLAEAFDLLGPDIAVFHAKDLAVEGDVAAGRGLLDYRLYFELIAGLGAPVPVIIHEVAEDDVERARDFVLAAASAAGVPLRLHEVGSTRQ